MSPLLVTEWIAKHPSQCEWENLVASGTKATENIKMWQTTEWGIEAEEGMDSASLYGGGCASGGTSGGTSFDPGYACRSKSSKSASMNSSSTEEMKLPKLSVKNSKVCPEDFRNKRDLASVELPGAPPAVDSSVCSGEPVLSLKLGKQSYFEEMSDRSNPRASNHPSVAKSSDVSAKRLKSNSQNISAPCCQVEGCNIDLSSAKDYHRKHRVCESHSKSPKVVVNGVERRFCQQCSRFHGLAEFDENKRSCRKRLSDHNARRRKSHPNLAHFNPARLSTIIYGGLQPFNSMYSEVPVEQTKSSVNSMWPNTTSLKFLQTKGDALKPAKARGIDGNLHVFHGNKLSNTMAPVTAISDGSSELQPVKGTTVKILGGGSEESLLSSSCLGASQDLHRALSLLSTNSCDSCKQSKPVLHDMNNTSISKLWTSGVPQALSSPLCLSEYWNVEQWPSSSLRHDLTPQNNRSSKGLGSSNFPEFMLPPEGEHEFVFESVHLS